MMNLKRNMHHFVDVILYIIKTRIDRNHNQSSSNIKTKRKNKYDEKGNMIEWISYRSDGSLIGKSTYKYEFDIQKIKTLGFNW